MGWKNVKEHYRIGHIVQIEDQKICIGSGYIHDLIVLGLDGTMLKRQSGTNNEELGRYQQEMDADPALLRSLIKTPDTFAASITVYTYKDGDILEKQCEQPGWPNVTHDGQVMYENAFSTDREVTVARAKEEAEISIRYTKEAIEETEQKLANLQSRLARQEANRAKLG